MMMESTEYGFANITNGNASFLTMKSLLMLIISLCAPFSKVIFSLIEDKKDNNQIWLHLLEKSFALALGGYE